MTSQLRKIIDKISSGLGNWNDYVVCVFYFFSLQMSSSENVGFLINSPEFRGEIRNVKALLRGGSFGRLLLSIIF